MAPSATAKARVPRNPAAETDPQKVTTVSRQGVGAETNADPFAGRLPVPDELVDLEADWGDERLEILKKHAPECLDKVNEETGRALPQSSDFVAYFGASDESADKMERMRYEPVRDEAGKHVNHRGDPLFKTPRELFMRRKGRIARRSHEVVSAQLTADDKTSKKEGFYVDESE